MTFRNGSGSLLRPQTSVHRLDRPSTLSAPRTYSHDPHAAVNASTALVKSAKVFNVPTILTCVACKSADSSFRRSPMHFLARKLSTARLSTPGSTRMVVDAVKATGQQLIIAGGLGRKSASRCR